ncbi:hypothetical protein [Aeropyrum camini]|uniref:Predicted CoA-binding protein n=1 Tax=Aeropyrum camini SY1 = JCM 12091 TaxID=1198449 RepID=U3TD17_9CREN|nr:hypothetical protein [Aeropyrum camini]BAN90321.1 predicted CoA-binding protein [Aeropyrum camini SY1 = JCM 12091]
MAERFLRDILSRRDPHGYYVIPLKPEARETLSRMRLPRDAKIVDGVDVILVKLRSRGEAMKLLRIFNRKGLIHVEGDEADEPLDAAFEVY